MLNWFRCYLSGRHDFGVWCEPGAIFLRCVHCGRRSSGWSLGESPQRGPALASRATSTASVVKAVAGVVAPPSGRVRPLGRAAS